MSNTITTKRESAEWLYLSPNIFKEEKANIFQNKTTFKIKVVSTPTPFSGPRTQTDDMNDIGVEGTDSRYIFKGRIIDSNMAHEKYLDDPCDASIRGTVKADVLESLHSNIIISNFEGMPNLSIGDYVYGELDAGDNGSIYDLQFINMSSISDVFSFPDSEDKVEKCAALKESFEQGWTGVTVDTQFTPLSDDVLNSTTNMRVIPANPDVAARISPEVASVLTELSNQITQEEIQYIIITNAGRTTYDQARINRDYQLNGNCSQNSPCLLGGVSYIDNESYFLALYSRNSDIVSEAIEEYKKVRGNRDAEINAIAEVYDKYWEQGRYISDHMVLRAADIGMDGLGGIEQDADSSTPVSHQKELLLEKLGAISGVTYVHENQGLTNEHIHFQVAAGTAAKLGNLSVSEATATTPDGNATAQGE
jgi:hypothetical protein